MKKLILLTLLFAFSLITADVKIQIQGFLADSAGIALNGSKNITFTLYDSDEAGDSLWNSTAFAVNIENGMFSYMLGEHDVIDSEILSNDTPLFLEIKIGDETLSPRVELGVETKSIYSYRAEDSNMLEGRTGSTSSVLDGRNNTASGDYSSVSAGRYNIASGSYSSVSGGGDSVATNGNTAGGNYSTIGGGKNRTVSTIYYWRAGRLEQVE